LALALRLATPAPPDEGQGGDERGERDDAERPARYASEDSHRLDYGRTRGPDHEFMPPSRLCSPE